MEINKAEIREFVSRVRAVSSYDFSNYSEKSLKRRLARINMDYKTDIRGLISKMEEKADFLERVVREITVNTTELFRDPNIWLSMRFEVLPLFKHQERINIWHAGCSSGQEVYSMTILLDLLDMLHKTRIYGTDLNSDMLERAKAGVYKYRFNQVYLENYDKVLGFNNPEATEHSGINYNKYLDIDKTRDLIKVKKSLLGKCKFRKHDIVDISNPFDISFDLIVCRNVIIYFNYELQNKVLKLFYNHLNPNGALLLGVHETILGPYAAYFQKKSHVYFIK